MTALPTGTLAAAGVLAADWKYWLPPVYSEHGGSIDLLFVWIFWITTVIFFIVEITLLVFLVKYRYRPERKKGIFTHGNTRLEMAWTLAPAVILIVLALATKRVWDRYRYSKDAEDPNRAQVLVVGQQFMWNFVFPGPDGQLGTYLKFPLPSDPPFNRQPWEKALVAIGTANEANPLGQKIDKNNPNDPGKDDSYSLQPGRPLILPVGRTIDIHLSAKDVLHDFFLPTFRVKLDAVPGLRGHIVFRGLPEAQSTQTLPLAQVPANANVWLDPDTPGVVIAGNPKRYRLPDPADKAQSQPARKRALIDANETLNFAARRRLQRTGKSMDDLDRSPELVAAEVEKLKADLAAMGVTQLAAITKPHEIVCEELCGQGHGRMRGEMYMVSNQQYTHFLNLTAPATPTTAPRPPAPPVAQAAEQAAPAAQKATQSVAQLPQPAARK